MDDDDNDDDLFLKISVRIEPLLLGCSDLSLFKIVIILTSGCYFLFKFSPFSIIHLCYGLICDLYIRGSSFSFKIIVSVAFTVAFAPVRKTFFLIIDDVRTGTAAVVNPVTTRVAQP